VTAPVFGPVPCITTFPAEWIARRTVLWTPGDQGRFNAASREDSMLANTTRALTEAQREQWAVDGYLQLEGALSPAEVDFFSDQIDRVRRQPGYEPAPARLPRGHYA
jgi:hypothetical protein